MRIPAAVLRDARPGGGMQRVLSAAAAFLAAPGGDVDVSAPAHKAQARPCCGARGWCLPLTWRAAQGFALLAHVAKALKARPASDIAFWRERARSG